MKKRARIPEKIGTGFKSSPAKHQRRRIAKALTNLNISENAKPLQKLDKPKLNEKIEKPELKEKISVSNVSETSLLQVKEQIPIEEIVQKPAIIGRRARRENQVLGTNRVERVESLEEDLSDENKIQKEKGSGKNEQMVYGTSAEAEKGYQSVKYLASNSSDYETSARNPRRDYEIAPQPRYVRSSREVFSSNNLRGRAPQIRGETKAVINRNLTDTEVWRQQEAMEKWDKPEDKVYSPRNNYDYRRNPRGK